VSVLSPLADEHGAATAATPLPLTRAWPLTRRGAFTRRTRCWHSWAISMTSYAVVADGCPRRLSI
jgi:hypothetical protein